MESTNIDLTKRILTTRLAQRKFYSSNKEYYKQYQKQYTKDHPEAMKRYRQKYYMKNREKINEYYRNYRMNSKHTTVATSSKPAEPTIIEGQVKISNKPIIVSF